MYNYWISVKLRKNFRLKITVVQLRVVQRVGWEWMHVLPIKPHEEAYPHEWSWVAQRQDCLSPSLHEPLPSALLVHSQALVLTTKTTRDPLHHPRLSGTGTYTRTYHGCTTQSPPVMKMVREPDIQDREARLVL
jgi:hypothetical protein